MDHREWAEFLKQWSRELISTPEIAANVPQEAIDQGWLGFPPATEEQIMAAEQRLGAVLPPSYKQFLRVTNGWRFTSFAIHHLLSTDELEWLRDNDPALISSWQEGAHLLEELLGGPRPVSDEEYFVYGEAQVPFTIRSEYLEDALQVSDVGDAALYLLNPRVVTQDSEWEAWFFATWLPGARRYQSFENLMKGEYDYFLLVKDTSRPL